MTDVKPKVVKVAERFYFPAFVSSSTWTNAYHACFDAAKKRGVATATGGGKSPRLTNREAVALVEAWRAVAPMQTKEPFSLAYQFEAVAWGWDPSSDAFDLSQKQADKLYPIDVGQELWAALFRTALALDDDPGSAKVSPRLDFDRDAFGDLDVQTDARRKLVEDGGVVAFKSPLIDAIKGTLKNPITPEQQKKIDDAIKKARKTLPRRPQEAARDLVVVVAAIAAVVILVRRVRRPRRVLRRRLASRRG